MELLDSLTNRTVVVALAILGAVIATIGGMLRGRQADNAAKFGRLLLWTGYAVSLVSVALFVIAGFLPGR